jgi:hypothetical protein
MFARQQSSWRRQRRVGRLRAGLIGSSKEHEESYKWLRQ